MGSLRLNAGLPNETKCIEKDAYNEMKRWDEKNEVHRTRFTEGDVMHKTKWEKHRNKEQMDLTKNQIHRQRPINWVA